MLSICASLPLPAHVVCQRHLAELTSRFTSLPATSCSKPDVTCTVVVLLGLLCDARLAPSKSLLVLSCHALCCLVLSCVILCCLVLPCLALCCLVSPCLVLFDLLRLASSCRVLSCRVSSCRVSHCLVLSGFTLFGFALPCTSGLVLSDRLVLSNCLGCLVSSPYLSRFVVFYLILLCLAMSCLNVLSVLFCLVLS